MSKIRKIEYFIFLLLFFLQNFALIVTENFGINGLVCYMFFLTIINGKNFYSKFEKKTFILIVFSIGIIILSSIVNNVFFVTQILRYCMMIWLIYVSNIYIRGVFERGEDKYFFKMYSNFLLVFLMYGIYEFIAIKFRLPLYLNIFGNNPSYEVKTLDRYYAGWTNTPRLYNAFFEPSVFSVFLVYNFFFIKEMKNLSTKNILFILIIFNLIFTYARTGYVIMIYISCIYFLYNIILKKNNRKKILDFIVLLLPFINMLIMYGVGLVLFKDLSSLARTYSPMYYLKETLLNFKSILIGNSTGSIVNGSVNLPHIESQAHNGYVDLLFQYGFIGFGMFFKFMYDKAQKIVKKKYLIIGIFATFCCFASYFCVETIIVQIVIIYHYCINEEKINGE